MNSAYGYLGATSLTRFADVTAAILLYARRAKIDKWYLADCIGCAAPLGLGLGRLANFINGELWGRVAPDLPWAMVFPGAGELPRHPSQLYQAGLEGLALFVIMFVCWRVEGLRRRPGTLTGMWGLGNPGTDARIWFMRVDALVPDLLCTDLLERL